MSTDRKTDLPGTPDETVDDVTSAPADPWMSLVEAARVLGESRQGILTRAVKGEVEAQHIAGRTVVSRASIDRVRRSKQES